MADEGKHRDLWREKRTRGEIVTFTIPYGQKLFLEENDKILISSIKLRFSLQN
jgi:hypothetical protein